MVQRGRDQHGAGYTSGCGRACSTSARYLNGLADEIAELERRPAHLTQSAEESSLDAWLEKYPYYRLPARSISYYNKGDVLGVLLDLQVREASKGSASIRDVFAVDESKLRAAEASFPTLRECARPPRRSAMPIWAGSSRSMLPAQKKFRGMISSGLWGFIWCSG